MTLQADIRLIAATNRDLECAVADRPPTPRATSYVMAQGSPRRPRTRPRGRPPRADVPGRAPGALDGEMGIMLPTYLPYLPTLMSAAHSGREP
jgi:hypothetical protein